MSDARIPVAILGATGIVGQRLVARLAAHPWFRIAELIASDRSAGRAYAEAVDWRLPGDVPEIARAMIVRALQPETIESRVVLSALSAELAGPAEELVPIERCGDTADGFDDWLSSMRRHAMAQGIAPDLVARALGPVSYAPEVIELDRAQKRQKRSFEDFMSSSCNHCTESASRWFVGSSRINKSGSAISARAIATRLRCPPDIV